MLYPTISHCVMFCVGALIGFLEKWHYKLKLLLFTDLPYHQPQQARGQVWSNPMGTASTDHKHGHPCEDGRVDQQP